MPSVRPEWEHFCVLILAQDRWKAKHYTRLSESTTDSFISSSAHGDCDVCLTCPVCRSMWELFDPYNLGEYNILCPICEQVLARFEDYKGAHDGLILFSHQIVDDKVVISFVNSILNETKVKKIYTFKYKIRKSHLRDKDFPQLVKEKKLKKTAFCTLVATEKFEHDVIYEVLKDNYY